MNFISNIAFQACLIGFISAVSLPFGSIMGLSIKPNAKVTSALMAFGGGALLFALTIEIVAHSFQLVGFGPLAFGCVIGGLLYELLNQGLNFKGGAFRKASTMIRELTSFKHKKAKVILEHLSKVNILHSMPPEDIAKLIPHIDELILEKDTVIFEENFYADALYLIDSGEVEIIAKGKSIAILDTGNTFGEIALLTDNPRNATAVTRQKTTLFRLSKNDFNELLKVSPEVKKAVQALLIERSNDLVKKSIYSEQIVNNWKKTSFHLFANPGFYSNIPGN